MAKLTGANAKFHTNGPIAKGPDSQIEITVTDRTGTIVAQESNAYGPFAVGSTVGPFPIPVLNEVERDHLQPGGNVTLNWLPVPAAASWDFRSHAGPDLRGRVQPPRRPERGGLRSLGTTRSSTACSRRAATGLLALGLSSARRFLSGAGQKPPGHCRVRAMFRSFVAVTYITRVAEGRLGG